MAERVPYSAAIDPMFAIPDGVTQLKYKNTNTSTSESSGVSATGSSADVGSVDSYDENGNDTVFLEESQIFVDSPDIISVIQTLSHAPGAPTVVDVLVTVEDITGASDYEIRITKE